MSTTTSMTAPDQALIEEVLHRIDQDPRLDASGIDLECKAGRVTLMGSVAWRYQKLAAEFDALSVPGVRAVDNGIVVHSTVLTRDVLDKIAGASCVDAADAAQIRVDVSGRVVTLIGTVSSWVGKHAAERAAWRTPGVAEVHSKLRVSSCRHAG